MNAIRKTTQQCVLEKESITYYSACTLREARPRYWCTLYTSSCHSAASLTCVSLVSPRITCAMFIKCSLPNDSRKHLDVYWSGSAFEESRGHQILHSVNFPYIRYWQHIALVMPCRESEWLEVLCICRDRNLKPRSLLRSPSAHVPRRCRCDE